jgi:hypothetical protein
MFARLAGSWESALSAASLREPRISETQVLQ